MNSLKFGSAEWREFVFGSTSVREGNDKKRPTLRGGPIVGGIPLAIDGLRRVDAVYIIEYLQLCRVVQRWKLWPFEWTPAGATKPRAPFMMVELASDRQLCVIQVASARYLTAKARAALDADSALASSGDLRHVVWTEESPLTAATRTLFMRLRGARTTEHDPASVDAIVAFVQARGKVALGEIAAAGHDPSLVFVAARKQRLYLPFSEAPGQDTLVAATPLTDPRQFLLGEVFDSQAWWQRLPKKVVVGQLPAALGGAHHG